MENAGGGKGDEPQADDEAADGEDPAAKVAVMGAKTGGFAESEELSAKPDEDQEGAENEREPCHG